MPFCQRLGSWDGVTFGKASYSGLSSGYKYVMNVGMKDNKVPTFNMF